MYLPIFRIATAKLQNYFDICKFLAILLSFYREMLIQPVKMRCLSPAGVFFNFCATIPRVSWGQTGVKPGSSRGREAFFLAQKSANWRKNVNFLKKMRKLFAYFKNNSYLCQVFLKKRNITKYYGKYQPFVWTAV